MRRQRIWYDRVTCAFRVYSPECLKRFVKQSVFRERRRFSALGPIPTLRRGRTEQNFALVNSFGRYYVHSYINGIFHMQLTHINSHNRANIVCLIESILTLYRHVRRDRLRINVVDGPLAGLRRPMPWMPWCSPTSPRRCARLYTLISAWTNALIWKLNLLPSHEWVHS